MRDRVFSVSLKLDGGTWEATAVLAEGFVHALAVAFPGRTHEDVIAVEILRCEKSDPDYEVKLAEARKNVFDRKRVV